MSWQDRSRLTRTGCFPPTRRSARSRAGSTRRCRGCRSSARTATPIRDGSPTTRPSATPTELLLAPDHYLFRMLYSQGVPLEALGVAAARGRARADPREAWRLFAGTSTCSAARRRRCGSTMCSPRCSGSTTRSMQRPPTTITTRIDAALATDGVPSARAVRALQHRGARDHREPDRRPRSPPAIRASGWTGPRDHRLPARSGGRSRARGVCRQRCARFAELTG